MDETQVEQKIQNIESNVAQILERNRKVEIDKAWETSKFRVLIVCLLTYGILTLVFWIIGVEHFMVNAVIPTLGFFLSTQSLPILKKWWTRKYFRH